MPCQCGGDSVTGDGALEPAPLQTALGAVDRLHTCRAVGATLSGTDVLGTQLVLIFCEPSLKEYISRVGILKGHCHYVLIPEEQTPSKGLSPSCS